MDESSLAVPTPGKSQSSAYQNSNVPHNTGFVDNVANLKDDNETPLRDFGYTV